MEYPENAPGLVKLGFQIPIPIGYEFNFASKNVAGGSWMDNAPNAPAGMVLTDGRTVQEANYVVVKPVGGKTNIYLTGNAQRGQLDLWGDGSQYLPTMLFGSAAEKAVRGGHGGGMQSGFFGAITPAEATNDLPIMHSIGLTVPMGYLGRRDSSGRNAFVWPAHTADGLQFYGNFAPAGFTPILAMGSLVAIPYTVDINTLPLQTRIGKKVADVLQRFGGYVKDSSGHKAEWIATHINFANLASEAVYAKDGIDLKSNRTGSTANSKWAQDVDVIWQNLRVVTNNSPTSIGGGGTPRYSAPAPVTAPPA
jgi:hypothetical protein